MSDFDAVYRQHYQAVFRYATRCAGRRDVAEELTSEAFVALWRAFAEIEQAQLPGWLFTVVKNRAIDYWRRSTLEQRHLASLERHPVPERSSSSMVEWLDATPALKPVHRACLILRYVHGLERAEIAARLGLTDNQVKGHLQYARQLLRRELVRNE
jgi:RNA polymerase sigma-70 factor, ECF subfamily